METITAHGKRCILYKNNKYSYQSHLKRRGEDNWRCTARGCNAALKTDEFGNIRVGKRPHRHPPKVLNESDTISKASLKQLVESSRVGHSTNAFGYQFESMHAPDDSNRNGIPSIERVKRTQPDRQKKRKGRWFFMVNCLLGLSKLRQNIY